MRSLQTQQIGAPGTVHEEYQTLHEPFSYPLAEPRDSPDIPESSTTLTSSNENKGKNYKPPVAAEPAELKLNFQDAVGRKFVFPWRLCSTWKSMEGLIKSAFLEEYVYSPHVQEGLYDLVNQNGELIMPQRWETMVQPGWTITMSMRSNFDEQGVSIGDN
ncbi:hypothetical protein DM02DRAFT_523112 [Periconia macrospinosa]|uniref:Ubiquitin-like domain-containing protein n=1 Tax=Periconia macrospinosa TaxID=97972 RepID=A0A2V1DZH8_9PLEO|nr:hypothetical protein DM02DRAFT_523112 [Periconia macrospinosa]